MRPHPLSFFSHRLAPLAAALCLVPVAAAAEGSYRFRVMVSAGSCLNLRAEPAPRAAVLDCVARGTMLRRLAVEGDWSEVASADERRGWVASRYLLELPGADPVTAEDEPATEPTAPEPAGVDATGGAAETGVEPAAPRAPEVAPATPSPIGSRPAPDSAAAPPGAGEPDPAADSAARAAVQADRPAPPAGPDPMTIRPPVAQVETGRIEHRLSELERAVERLASAAEADRRQAAETLAAERRHAAELDDAVTRLEAAAGQRQRGGARRASAQERNRELAAALDRLEGGLDTDRQQASELRATVGALSQAVARLEQAADARSRELATALAQLDEGTERSAELAGELAELRSTLPALSRALAAVEQAQAGLAAETAAVREEVVVAVAELRPAVAAAEAAQESRTSQPGDRLEARLGELSGTLSGLATAVDKLRDEVGVLAAGAAEQAARLSRLESRWAEAAAAPAPDTAAPDRAAAAPGATPAASSAAASPPAPPTTRGAPAPSAPEPDLDSLRRERESLRSQLDRLETEMETSAGEPTAVPAATEAEIWARVEAWARAWSAQAVDEYLSFYSPRFDPGDGSSRAAWAATRRERLAAPSQIEVTISLLGMSPTPTGVEVRFIQAYRSNAYRDVVTKILRMAREDGRWLILSEQAQ